MADDSPCQPGLLDRAAAEDHRFSSIAERLGAQIGHYKLLEQIGEGGFGVVWMAEQEEPLRRRVALKIIKPGMNSREVIARFEAERQALAMMDHPNIASIFDGGATQMGLPYFVMELVQGVPITTYCDANRLSTSERLKLFMEVCHAVQHAHQKGIIHRDLKPSNILITVKDGRPVPKVIDFGIAKAIQASPSGLPRVTRLNQWLGTPEYMSPEQAGLGGLDVDTRSDIYALGVLFYELLAGYPPFSPETLRDAGYDAILRVIREEDPPKPSSRLSALTKDQLGTVAENRGLAPAKLNRQLRGDLDWIVMKALEKDRCRRYETANGLADDIRRHLDNEVVLARPPSALYRLKKAWRRHKVGFAAAAMVTAALVLGAVLSTWQALRATRAERLATQRLADSEAISQFLTSTFQSPDPARDGRTITVAEMLDTAAKQLDTDLADQPARQASLKATIGSTYYALGLFREAAKLLEDVRDHHRLADGPEHPETLKTMHRLACAYSCAGRRDEALKLQEEVLALSRKLLGPQHPDTLAAMGNLANCYSDTGRQTEAVTLREEVLQLMRRVNGNAHPDTLTAMANLATSYYHAGRRTEALNLREKGLPLSVEVNGPAHPATLLMMSNLAVSYYNAGRLEEALKLREGVLSFSRRVNGPTHPDTLVAMTNLATSYFDAGRRDEALKLREEVLPLYRKKLGPEHSGTLTAMTNLAGSLGAAGRLAEAIELQQNSLVIQRRLLPQGQPLLLIALKNMARLYDETGRTAEAHALRQEIAALQANLPGSGPQSTAKASEPLKFEELKAKADAGDAQAQFALGLCYANGTGVKRDEVEAVKWWRKAAEQGIADAQYNLGVFCRDGLGIARDEAAAVGWFLKAAEQNDAMAQHNLAVCYRDGQGVVKDHDEEVKWLRRAAGQNLPSAQLNLGHSYANGRGVEKNAEEAMKWWRKAADQNLAAAQCGVGICYRDGRGVAKDEVEAVKWFRKAAGQNDAVAQHNLGVCCRDGQGMAQDDREAAYWWRKAAEQNFAASQFNLGLCYAMGQGVAMDLVEAYSWLLLAAAQGIEPARQVITQVELSLTPELRTEGQQRAHNFKLPEAPSRKIVHDGSGGKLLADLRMLAESGNPKAQHELGEAFLAGKLGLAKDSVAAAMWFRQAAAQGFAPAQTRLGICYERGDGVAKHEPEAYRWYLVAAAQGDAKARDYADLLELSLTETQIANGKRWAGDFKRQSSATPLFPALRSGPTAVSGAFREKQTPDSK